MITKMHKMNTWSGRSKVRWVALLLEPVGAVADSNAVGDRILDKVGGVRRVEERDQQASIRQSKLRIWEQKYKRYSVQYLKII